MLETVHKVARLSATVLILGESGTGKELLAPLLHRQSSNPDAPFVAVHVAAIPLELVESTLFGHQKGSFTGALFLDQIGDLKPDLQAKLLRAIQEGEVERVGGNRAIRTQFRLIAATNVDLPFEMHVVEPDRTKSDTSLPDCALATFERKFLVRALARNAWNVTQTARYLGVPLSTLKFKMERLDIRELARKIKK